MDYNYYSFLEYLKHHSKFNILFIETSEQLQLDEILNPEDIIIALPNYSGGSGTNDYTDYIKKFKNIKILDIEDVKCRCKYKCIGNNKECNWNFHLNKNKLINYDYYFCKYKTYITDEFSKINNVIYFPHYIDSNNFCDRQLDKEFDILLYGYDDINAYPFRNRLFNIIKKNNDKFTVKHIPFLGWDTKAKRRGVCNAKLSEMINKSKITIVTKSINNLLLKKYTEVSMSNSVMCGDFPDLEENLWENCMIYIDNNMSDDEIINKIIYYLDNINLLQEMANKAYQITSNRYTYEHGLRQFESIINSLMVNSS